MTAIATIGHSNRSIERFCDLLCRHQAKRLVDVRRYLSSAYNPQFNRAALAASLNKAGIDYEHVPALGGRRASGASTAKNAGWSEPAFRNYADFALTSEFQAALRDLIFRAEKEMWAIMCAERDWRQCHRQIIADYLIAHGCAVTHLIDENRAEAARIAPSAVRQADGTILYPARQGELRLSRGE